VLCGGEPFVPSDPKLRGGYYMTPCILGKPPMLISKVQAEITEPFLVFVLVSQMVCSKSKYGSAKEKKLLASVGLKDSLLSFQHVKNIG